MYDHKIDIIFIHIGFNAFLNFKFKLEREVYQYKSRLDELRKAKNSLIIKKTTEYVRTGAPSIGYHNLKTDTSMEFIKLN